MIKNLTLLTLTTILLSGCITISPLTGAIIALDVGSYVGTSKGLSDHVVSSMTGKDCATHRVITEGKICRDDKVPANKATYEPNSIRAYNCRMYSWDKNYFEKFCK